MAQRVVDSRDGTGGGANALAMFAWEAEETPFNDGVPIQSQIYRPDDPNCKGLVAFFGERIGQPLAEDFPTDMLAELLAAADTSPYRLVHPWDPDSAADGGFPLTGSTFEVLCAVAANRRARNSEHQRELPIFLTFASAPSVLDADVAEDADWGNRRLREQVLEQFRTDRRTRQRLENEIAEQLECLSNFAMFLQKLGLYPRFEADEDMIETALGKWLTDRFLLVPDPLKIDPFRGLRSYDVDDYRVYFGRSEAQRDAVRRIESMVADSRSRNFYWIMGSSGAGKSSFLRAGVVGGLRHSWHSRAEYLHTIHRPNSLLSKAAAMAVQSQCPLRALFAQALETIAGAPGGAWLSPDDRAMRLSDFDAIIRERRPAWTADALEALLQRSDRDARLERPTRLVVGIDQFEEIVDMLEDADLGPKWEDFASFLAEAPNRPRLVVLATMRREREEKMRRRAAFELLWRDTVGQRTMLSFPSPTELESIIRRPFSELGRALLSDELVEHLKDSVNSYVDRHIRQDEGSVLPLVSLCLQRIHEHVAVPLIQARHQETGTDPTRALNAAVSDPTSEQPASGPVTITMQAAKGHTQLEGVIAHLAERAMSEAREQNALEAGETTVDGLLRQLVRWSGQDDKQFYLPAVTLAEDASQKALARALLRHRLLVDDGGGRVRLVHETVLQHWPEGRSFCERERPLHEGAGVLAVLADTWARPNAGRSVVDVGLENHAETAFQLLSLWAVRMHPFFCEAPDPRDSRLRDYCLALLDACCDPTRVVRGTPNDTTHLYLASFYGRRDTVARMLDKSPDAVNDPRKDGRTPLYPPCFVGDVALLDLLIERGAEVSVAEKKDHWQPMHAAAVGGDVALARRLIAAGADPGAGQAPHGIWPFHLAARHGWTSLVDYFIDDLGLDPDLPDGRGWTPLMHAQIDDLPDMVRHLVDRGADLVAPADRGPEALGLRALHIAARDGHVRSLEALLELGTPPDLALRNDAGAIHLAAHNGFPACVRVLARHLNDIDGRAVNLWRAPQIDKHRQAEASRKPGQKASDKASWTALHLAAAAGHVKTVSELLDCSADVNAATASGSTALHLAIYCGHDQTAVLLSGRGADMEQRDGDGRTALQHALEKARYGLADDLVRQGAKIDATVRSLGFSDDAGITLLHTAATEKEDTLLVFALNHHADAARPSAAGRTALHVAAAAAREGHVARLLVRSQGSLFAPDRDGITPVEVACATGSDAVLEAMLRVTDSDTVRARCPLALHFAARGGRGQVVRRLLTLGFSPDHADAAGFTPLHLAALHAGARAVDALLAGGADPALAVQDGSGRPVFALAVEAHASEVLRRLLKTPAAAAVDLVALAFRALELEAFDCVAALLEFSGQPDLRHPGSGLALSQAYVDRIATMAATFPRNGFRSPALEALLPESARQDDGPAEPAPDTKPDRPVRSGRRPGTRAVPAAGRRGREHPLGADLAPEYDSGPNRLWSDVTGENQRSFLAQLSPVDGKHALDPESTQVFWRQLPWYDDVALIQVRDAQLENPKLRFYYLTMAGNLYRLNGTSPPIHEVNAKAPIRLTADNVSDYLRFFCFFVRGEEGPFYLCEYPQDPFLPRHPAVNSVVAETVRPITYEGQNDSGYHLCNGTIYYSNAIFVAEFAVQPSGMIEMLADEPVAADLPVKIDAPLA